MMTPEEVKEMLDKTTMKDRYSISTDLFDIIIHNKI